jgi:hypothetical protein
MMIRSEKKIKKSTAMERRSIQATRRAQEQRVGF